MTVFFPSAPSAGATKTYREQLLKVLRELAPVLQSLYEAQLDTPLHLSALLEANPALLAAFHAAAKAIENYDNVVARSAR